MKAKIILEQNKTEYQIKLPKNWDIEKMKEKFKDQYIISEIDPPPQSGISYRMSVAPKPEPEPEPIDPEPPEFETPPPETQNKTRSTSQSEVNTLPCDIIILKLEEEKENIWIFSMDASDQRKIFKKIHKYINTKGKSTIEKSIIIL